MVFTILHASRTCHAVNDQDDDLSHVWAFLWLQVLLGWSLISTSVPAFKTFMQPLDIANVGNISTIASRSRGTSAYMMMGTSKADNVTGKKVSVPSSRDTGQMRLRPDEAEHRATIKSMSGPSIDRHSLESSCSRADIIRKDVMWEVHHYASKTD